MIIIIFYAHVQANPSTLVFTLTHIDHIYDCTANTAAIFEEAVKGLVISALEGINATVFAYGQTASGKTFTVRGNEKCPGLIPLSIYELFEGIQAHSTYSFKVTVSFFELYNETINDLLEPVNKNLEIRENYAGVWIKGLSEKNVNNPKEALEYLQLGDSMKKVGETKLNQESSRSHTVFRITIESKALDSTPSASSQISQLNLVDLAGSEAVSRTKAEGMRRWYAFVLRYREGMKINKSLLALSNVIQRLSSGQAKFINYRDSKLTRMLQPALGGNSKTAIICTISKLKENYQEALNTILFGTKAKNIKNNVKVNEIIKDTNARLVQAMKEIQRLKEQLAKGTNRISGKSRMCSAEVEKMMELLKNELVAKEMALESKDRILSQFEGINKQVAVLNEQVEVLTDRNEALNRENIELHIRIKERQLDIEEKSQELERLKDDLMKKTKEMDEWKVNSRSEPLRDYSLNSANEHNLELENKRLTMELNGLKETIESEQEDKASSEMSKDEMKYNFEESMIQCEKLYNELKDAIEEKEKLREELDKFKAEYNEIKEREVNYIQTIQSMKETIDSLQFVKPKIGIANSMNIEKYNELKLRNETVEDQNKRLLGEIEFLNQSVRELKKEISKLNNDNEQLLYIKGSYEVRLGSLKKEVERLQIENQGTRMELQGKFGRVEILEREKRQLRADIDSYRESNTKQKKKLEKVHKENQRIIKELEEANNTINEANNSLTIIKEKNNKIKELENKIRLLYEQSMQFKKENDKVKSERDALFGKIQEIKAMKFNRMEALEIEIINNSKVIEELKNERALLIESNEIAQKELEVFQTSLNNLKEENQEKENLLKELEEKEKELKSLRFELSQYKDSLEIERRRFFSSLKNKDTMIERNGKRTIYSNLKDSVSKLSCKENALKEITNTETLSNYLI